jgi:phage baseplate assembly protein W
MRPPADLALRIGLVAPDDAPGPEVYADRVRMVLETQPGTLPWRPDFGCDLDGLVGAAMTPGWISEAEGRVRVAVQRWLPGVRVRRCDLQVRTTQGVRHEGRLRTLPVAEASVLPYGADASLEIHLDLDTPSGPLSLQLDIPG